MLVRLFIFTAVIAMLGWGARRIWRDWTGAFRAADKARHDRDIRERDAPDVITLERQEDGSFRPPRH